MLSWSNANAGGEIDLTGVASGDGAAELDHGPELLRFATACGERDDEALISAREVLVAATDEAFMVDAAAVAANFEMMTRLADSTGARLEEQVIESRASMIGAMGVAELTSRR